MIPRTQKGPDLHFLTRQTASIGLGAKKAVEQSDSPVEHESEPMLQATGSEDVALDTSSI